MKPQERGKEMVYLFYSRSYVVDWIKNNNVSVWLDLESSQVNQFLCGLLFTSGQKKIKASIGDNMIINRTIKAWWETGRTGGTVIFPLATTEQHRFPSWYH